MATGICCNRGMGLLEVLAASAVLATGMACLLQLHGQAQQLDMQTRQRLEASLLMMELSEWVVMATHLQIPPTRLSWSESAVCTSAHGCSPQDFLQSRLVQWQQHARQNLPDMAVDVTVESDQRLLTVRLSWSTGEHRETFLW